MILAPKMARGVPTGGVWDSVENNKVWEHFGYPGPSPSVCRGSEHGRDKTDFRPRESGGMRDPPPPKSKTEARVRVSQHQKLVSEPEAVEIPGVSDKNAT